jgi:hypothetical protein
LNELNTRNNPNENTCSGQPSLGCNTFSSHRATSRLLEGGREIGRRQRWRSREGARLRQKRYGISMGVRLHNAYSASAAVAVAVAAEEATQEDGSTHQKYFRLKSQSCNNITEYTFRRRRGFHCRISVSRWHCRRSQAC